MQKTRRQRMVAMVVFAVAVASCTTSPLGRAQLKVMPRHEVDEAGAMAFSEILRKKPGYRDAAINAYVLCVTRELTAQLSGPAARLQWQVVVFDDLSPNAFALPGGKIGVNRGMLRVARTQDQLAAVVGHEIAHVQAEHANERMSAAYAASSAIGLGAAAASGMDPAYGQAVNLLGTGAQLGVLMPYSRAHEREADLMGLDLMARAGFDPDSSIVLWERMAELSSRKPPEFLSTHPSEETRMGDLRERLPKARAIYRNARARGRHPECL